jgi:hypothetical protein
VIRSQSRVVSKPAEGDWNTLAGRIDEAIASLAADRDVLHVAVTPLYAMHESRHTHAISELVASAWVSFIVTVVWLE